MQQFLIICALVALFVAPQLGLTLPQNVLTIASIIIVAGIALVANNGVNRVRKGNLRETGKELGMFAKDVKSAAKEISDGFKEEAPKSTNNTKNKA